ncbi:hypothetical protein Q604_UNBc4C00146G0001, partial [human gut metagenome]
FSTYKMETWVILHVPNNIFQFIFL